jgi:hypothetical protein
VAHREILFVDPAVSNPATLLCGLRPGLEAIMLDADRPTSRQITEAARPGRSSNLATRVRLASRQVRV